MTDYRIGAWVTRNRGETRLTLPHCTESVVTDEPVTRCGRRLKARAGTHFAYVTVPAIRPCKVCA